MAELRDDEMEPMLDSLSLFSNVDLSFKSNPQRWPFLLTDAVVKLDGHAGSDVYLPAEAWSAYLKAGRSFGWQPQGTSATVIYLLSNRGAWDGSYSPAVGQQVVRDDARRLSMALDRLVDAVRSGEELTEEQLEAVKALACLDKDLSGAQEVADFALEGGFSVEDAERFRR